MAKKKTTKKSQTVDEKVELTPEPETTPFSEPPEPAAPAAAESESAPRPGNIAVKALDSSYSVQVQDSAAQPPEPEPAPLPVTPPEPKPANIAVPPLSSNHAPQLQDVVVQSVKPEPEPEPTPISAKQRAWLKERGYLFRIAKIPTGIQAHIFTGKKSPLCNGQGPDANAAVHAAITYLEAQERTETTIQSP